MKITHVAAIHLERRPDRLATLEYQWRARGLKQTLHITDAIDGLNQPLEPAWRRYGPGAYGCVLSHLNLLATAPRDGALLVLEDDALLHPEFRLHVYNLLPQILVGTDIVLLGYERTGYVLPVTEDLVRPTGWRRTHGYLVCPGAHERVMHALMGRQGHADRLLATAGLTIYASRRPLVGQTAGVSDVSAMIRGNDMFWDR